MECANIRYFMTFLLCTTAFSSYLMRSSLSVTIVAMTGENSTSHKDTNGTTPAPHEHKGAIVPLSNYQQGLALGAYFWGYTAPQVPGGMLVEKFGTRFVLLISLCSGGILCLLTPLAATNSWVTLTIVRVLLGVTQCVIFPSNHCFMGRWVPPSEKARAAGLTYTGTTMGIAVCFLIAGIMSETLGWESVFYVIGTFSIVIGIIWAICTANEPRMHRNISQKELSFIKSEMEGRGEPTMDRPPTPWKHILRSIPVWSLVLAHVTNNWVLYLSLTCLPMFMHDVVGVDLKSNGVYSALPNIVFAISCLVLSQLSDLALGKGWLDRPALRKGATVISGIGQAVCCLIACFVANKNTWLAVLLISISGAFAGFQSIGFTCVFQDMAAQYVASVFAVSNFFSSIPGMIVPSIVTAMTGDKTRKQWLNVFILQAVVSILGAVQFAILGSTDVQYWASKRAINNKVESVPDSINDDARRRTNSASQQ